jgi:hypothetical protein
MANIELAAVIRQLRAELRESLSEGEGIGCALSSDR